ncbi:DUF4214 domain-containing protein [Methylobacterium nigriterrae]|uniref:DUF4214 domain-containing protein n=1 Tax=Methylobacterium nigriterrae TaxID=3127512 RepID=UPI003013E447
MAATSTLSISVSAHSYEGDPQFIVEADGFQIGGVFTTGAQRTSGQSQTVTLSGDLSWAHQISVTYINDYNPVLGNFDFDRNLYVNSITYGGQTFAGSSATHTSAVAFLDTTAALYGTGSAVTFNINGYAGPYTIDGDLFGTLVHDGQGPGGEIYALYDGLLGRAPDLLGLEGWTHALSHGTSLHDIAQAFLASPEGQARTGALGNAAFVEQLYESALDRHSDPAGLSYWTAALDAGAQRADVALGFVLSSEHLASLKSVYDAGLFVPDAHAADVARLYYAVLDRAPDAAGLSGWTSQLDQGASVEGVAQAFLAAPEVQAKTGALTNAQYIDWLYENALGRHAEAAGLGYWTDQLDHGASRAGLAIGIGLGAEAQQHHLAEIEAGWHVL